VSGRGYDAAKRAFDVAVAVAVLLVSWPLLATVAAAIRFEDSGPILYRGKRAGRGGRPFQMFKFRTMIVDAETRGGASAGDDDIRITTTGAWMRRLKLDELPQLWTVLRGDMSLVGPRPQVLDEVARYSLEERALLDVRPGITDFASIAFRNEGEILRGHGDPDEAYRRLIRPRKMRLALAYLQRRSFLVDMAILWATAVTIVLRRPPDTVARERIL
jgi:lipopolysaccharide/colanic/teichoic acid biosynthesis glycosyltransferase